MAVNKVVYAGRTLVDLTGDSVTPDTLAEGVTAHAASGEGVTGTMTAVQYGKSQSLTTAQKTQARTNIGAASAAEVSQLSAEIGTKVEQALTEAKASGEFDGPKGDKGVGIEEIGYNRTPDANGEIHFVIQLTDGQSYSFTLRNGKDGTSPVKGVHYWTPADQESIVQDVITALGTPVFGTIDKDNNIILTGNLADGKYTLKYENALGEVIDIGTVDIGGGVTNMIKLSINSDGTLYNGGKGWKTGYRLNSSGVEASATGMEVVGFIPVKLGDIAYFGNMKLIVGNSAAQASNQYIVVYDAAFAKIATTKFTDAMLSNANTTYTADASGNLKSLAIDYGLCNFMGVAAQSGNVKYFRISAEEINDDSIITLNEPLE